MTTSAATQRQFPCKQCGAKVDYAPGTSTLKCTYCSAETLIPTSEEHIEELDYNQYLAKVADEHETQEAKRVTCDKCGAETTMPPEQAAGNCPFCGRGCSCHCDNRDFGLGKSMTSDQRLGYSGLG